GDGVEAERVAELDHHRDERMVRDLEIALDERAVDLELVEWQAVEVGERAVARSEVVDGQANTERAQLVECSEHARLVADEDGLGDLEREEMRRQPTHAQRARDDRREVAAIELAAGDV